MKISTFLTLILVISAFVFTFASMVNDSKDYYPDSETNISSWENEYDYYDNISAKVDKIKTPITNLADEDKGWILKTIGGVAAIPAAFIALVTVVLSSFVHGGSIITNVFTSIGIHAYIIAIVLVMITLWGVIKLLEAIQRWPL